MVLMTEVLDKDTLKALSTDTRQDIIKMLSNRPYTASEISKITKKHVTTVTEHLNVLEKSGLIHRKDSTNKWVYYELSDKGGRLFKTKIYSWVVMIAISALIFMFGFSQVFFTNFGTSSSSILMDQKAETIAGALNATTVPSANVHIENTFGIFFGIILMAVAIFIIVYFYKAHRVRKALI